MLHPMPGIAPRHCNLVFVARLGERTSYYPHFTDERMR